MGGMLAFRSRPPSSVSSPPAPATVATGSGGSSSTSSDYRPAAAAAAAIPAAAASGVSRACGPLRLCVCSKRRLQVLAWNDECKTLDELIVRFCVREYSYVHFFLSFVIALPALCNATEA